MVKKTEENDDSQEQRVKELETIRKRLAELEHGQKLGLVWRDIPEDVETLLRDEMPVLIHEPDLDIPGKIPSDQSHILIEGDNLHALHVLQATHKDSIDVIFTDPPYNTGKDFIYNDKLIDEEDPFRHSAWLSFMNKRLRLAKDLLTEDGIIFITIGQDEVSGLNLLCNSIFGEQNFITSFIWEKTQHFGRQKVNFYSNNDYVLCYAKSKKDKSIKELLVEYIKTEHEDAPLYNASNKLQTLRFPAGSVLFNIPDGKYSSTTDKKYDLLGPVVVQKSKNKNDFELRYKSRWSQKNIDLELLKGTTFWIKTENFAIRAIYGDGKTSRESPKQIIFTNTNNEFVAKSRFGSKVGVNEEGSNELKSAIGDQTIFEYPKPRTLIEYLVSLVFDPSVNEYRDDLVILDFFAGSGTTLHAVAELNAADGGTRQCILVTNNENSICRDVTQPRLKAVLTGKWADKQKHDPLPGSLSFYKTGFIKRLKSPDRMRTEIAKHTVDLIAIKEGAGTTVSRMADLTVLYGLNKTIAVVPSLDPDHVKLHANAEKKVRAEDQKTVYVFTWSNQGVEEETAALWPGWVVQPLPSEMLAALRRIAPAPRLFDVDGGSQ